MMTRIRRRFKIASAFVDQIGWCVTHTCFPASPVQLGVQTRERMLSVPLADWRDPKCGIGQAAGEALDGGVCERADEFTPPFHSNRELRPWPRRILSRNEGG